MAELPTFSDAADAAGDVANAARDRGRTLLPWLPDPPTCECGAMMYADVTFDPQMAEYVSSWTCRTEECDAPDRYRDDPNVPDPDPPSEGATQLRETLSDHD